MKIHANIANYYSLWRVWRNVTWNACDSRDETWRTKSGELHPCVMWCTSVILISSTDSRTGSIYHIVYFVRKILKNIDLKRLRIVKTWSVLNSIQNRLHAIFSPVNCLRRMRYRRSVIRMRRSASLPQISARRTCHIELCTSFIVASQSTKSETLASKWRLRKFKRGT